MTISRLQALLLALGLVLVGVAAARAQTMNPPPVSGYQLNTL